MTNNYDTSAASPSDTPLGNAARIAAFASLSIIFLWFGGMKFTAYEAEAISGLIINSPFLAFTLALFSAQGISNLIGSVELIIGLLIAARFFAPRLAHYGALAAAGTFVMTSSFFFTTPGVFEPSVGGLGISVMPGQFLLKDIGLFALALWAAADSLAASRAK